jgi:dipeptidyl-peptidase 4
MQRFIISLVLLTNVLVSKGQNSALDIRNIKWLPNSHFFWNNKSQGISLVDATDLTNEKLLISSQELKKIGLDAQIEDIVWNASNTSVLLYTESQRVWRDKTKGNYWYFNTITKTGYKLGGKLPNSSLMFAKFSPTKEQVAYVSNNSLYVEDLKTKAIKTLALATKERKICGTYDWVYEEELGARDGFSWSPGGNAIAFAMVDAAKTPKHLMINNTDSLYSYIIPVEYPKAGLKPSGVQIATVNIATGVRTILKIPGEATNNYLPRFQWTAANEVTAIQLSRLQNTLTIYTCNAQTGVAKESFKEKSDTWIDLNHFLVKESDVFPAYWLEKGKTFLWNSEKDGWQHIYKVSLSANGSAKEELLTTAPYDAYFVAYNTSNSDIYFIASPTDATQRYLYSVNLNTKLTQKVTPTVFNGTNKYSFSTDGTLAFHEHMSINALASQRLVSLPEHKKIYPMRGEEVVRPRLNYKLEKIVVKTAENIELDGLMAKPLDFDSTKKYPVYFYVYGEPANVVVTDVPRFTDNFIGELIPKGYIAIALDNRGTPSFKGRDWRKSIYKKIGVINAHDQAMAAKEILKWKYIDPERVAVHGWSGGGAMTLNLLFKYPEIYKTGVSIASITDQHFYDNIYTERYMGLPEVEKEAYYNGSPVNFAKNLIGNLLYIHGTADDNVHYKNAEQLVNELIKNNKLFQFMPYPNRTHGIYEGEGTRKHLSAVVRDFILKNCPPGGK